jgi:hypothetical protein
MRPPIPRVGLRWHDAAIGLLVLTDISVGAVRADAATYPNPGVVTGAITGVHGKLGLNLVGWDSAGWPYVY